MACALCFWSGTSVRGGSGSQAALPLKNWPFLRLTTRSSWLVCSTTPFEVSVVGALEAGCLTRTMLNSSL